MREIECVTLDLKLALSICTCWADANVLAVINPNRDEATPAQNLIRTVAYQEFVTYHNLDNASFLSLPYGRFLGWHSPKSSHSERTRTLNPKLALNPKP